MIGRIMSSFILMFLTLIIISVFFTTYMSGVERANQPPLTLFGEYSAREIPGPIYYPSILVENPSNISGKCDVAGVLILRNDTYNATIIKGFDVIRTNPFETYIIACKSGITSSYIIVHSRIVREYSYNATFIVTPSAIYLVNNTSALDFIINATYTYPPYIIVTVTKSGINTSIVPSPSGTRSTQLVYWRGITWVSG